MIVVRSTTVKHLLGKVAALKCTEHFITCETWSLPTTECVLGNEQVHLSDIVTLLLANPMMKEEISSIEIAHNLDSLLTSKV